MHDCYQQQNPLNEAPLNRNTILPPGSREERQHWFFLALVSGLINVQWEASVAERMKDKHVQCDEERTSQTIFMFMSRNVPTLHGNILKIGMI